jgi:hypothetical protein
MPIPCVKNVKEVGIQLLPNFPPLHATGVTECDGLLDPFQQVAFSEGMIVHTRCSRRWFATWIIDMLG